MEIYKLISKVRKLIEKHEAQEIRCREKKYPIAEDIKEEIEVLEEVLEHLEAEANEKYW